MQHATEKKEILQTGVLSAERILLQIHSLRISCVAEAGCEDYRNCKKYHVSRQTIYSQIKRVHNFSEDPDVKMRMYFMNRDYLCTMIDIDFYTKNLY